MTQQRYHGLDFVRAIAMLLGLSVRLFRSRTPTVRIPGTVSPSVTGLVGASVGLLAVGSVWAVIAGFSEGVPSWVGTSREIGNLLVPLVALVLLGRQADFNGWSRLFYTWTVALAAALLAVGVAAVARYLLSSMPQPVQYASVK